MKCLVKNKGVTITTLKNGKQERAFAKNWIHPKSVVLSSVKVGENHFVLGYGRERPMY